MPARSGSRVTTIVVDRRFPTRSTAAATMVFGPGASGRSGRMKVRLSTAAGSPLTITVTSSALTVAPGMMSFTVPATVALSTTRRSPARGVSITMRGGSVSRRTVTECDADRSLLEALATSRLVPSASGTATAVKPPAVSAAGTPLTTTESAPVTEPETSIAVADVTVRPAGATIRIAGGSERERGERGDVGERGVRVRAVGAGSSRIPSRCSDGFARGSSPAAGEASPPSSKNAPIRLVSRVLSLVLAKAGLQRRHGNNGCSCSREPPWSSWHEATTEPSPVTRCSQGRTGPNLSARRLGRAGRAHVGRSPRSDRDRDRRRPMRRRPDLRGRRPAAATGRRLHVPPGCRPGRWHRCVLVSTVPR